MSYLFTSQRLGFRTWLHSDLPKMAAINADVDVMKYFPEIQSAKQTQQFIDRMQKLYSKKGFCYFAVELLERNELIGFIGLSEQNFEADFTPCVDIGWRLNKAYWAKGYATEGAKRVLQFAFSTLKLEQVVAIAPVINKGSEKVMQKIGMQKIKTFNHPLMVDIERLRECVLYEINN